MLILSLELGLREASHAGNYVGEHRMEKRGQKTTVEADISIS